MAQHRPGGTQAVDRAAALVDLVVRADEPLSFTELSDETGLARSTTSRLLAALERTDLLERDAAGGVRRRAAVRAARRAPRPVAAGRPAGPARSSSGRRATPARPSTSACARGDDVVHIAQVDSTFLLGARDWNQVDVPAALLVARQGALRLRRAAAAARPARAPHRPHRHHAARRSTRRARARPPPRLRDHRRRARDRAHRYRRAGRGRATAWSPRSASPGPPHGSRTGSTASVGS